jgi:imidazolonepropionase-like amidohydrolase
MHGKNTGELKLLVEQGFSPSEAIQAGTREAARVLGVERDLGTIEEGKLADLIVVEGNPLEDITRLLKSEDIPLIMQGGKLVKEERQEP